MPEQFFNQHALYWIGALIAIFVMAKLLVARHSHFQSWPEAQKGIAIKGITLGGFVILYIIVTLISPD